VKESTLPLALVLLFGVLVAAALPVSPLWYLIPPLFAAFLAVLAAGRRAGDPGFLALCTGELLVATAGAGVPGIVLPLQCLLVGIVLAELHLLGGTGDLSWFGAYTLAACACLALVLFLHNILVSGLIAVGIFACIYLGLTVGEHEQRRVLSGGLP
jgi:hypothetical protein